MQSIDAVCLYESVAREVDALSAIKCIAEERYGLRIELVQLGTAVTEAVTRYKPQIVVLPHCYQIQSYPQAMPLNWRKSIYLNLAWEQILYEGNRKVKTPRGDFAKHFVLHHSWSDAFAKYLEGQAIPEKNIFVNGNPSYTLYEAPYSQYFKCREELAGKYALDPERQWVFFPENYVWSFYDDPSLEGLVRLGATPEHVEEMTRFCQRSLEETTKWCAAAALEGGIELILRPRPATPLNDFKAAIGNILKSLPSRLHITKSESTREWILASDVIVSSYSTSLIEAAIAGKSAYLLEPYPIPASLHCEWHRYITHTKTKQEFADACLRQPDTSNSEQLSHWARKNLLSRGDAIWRIADLLAKIVSGEARCPPFPSRTSVIPRVRHAVPPWLAPTLFEYRRLRQRMAQNSPKQPDEGVASDDTHHETISPEEIEQRVTRWKGVLKSYSPASD